MTLSDDVLEKIAQLKSKESTLQHTRPDFDETLEALRVSVRSILFPF